MLEIKQFVFSPFSENTYLLWDRETLETAVIDPGCYNTSEEQALAGFIEENNLNIKFLINTHCHIDHVFGNVFVIENYKPLFLAPEKDLPLLREAVKQGELFGVEVKTSPDPDRFITEDMDVRLGETLLEFLFTPGHTAGEYCIYSEQDGMCVSGDVLFNRGIGRTDLWGGDYITLINSIEQKLFVLPDETVVYPGHGDKTSIGFEKLNNPFLK